MALNIPRSKSSEYPSTQYCYYIRGREIAIVEWSKEKEQWVSPLTDITEGLLVEYSSLPDVPSNTDGNIESQELNLDPTLQLAVEAWMTKKMLERSGKLKESLLYRKEFNSLVYRHEKNKSATIRVIQPSFSGSIL